MDRRLAALLMADVVGYSRLMEADEATTLDRLRAWQQTVLKPTLDTHGGRIVKLVGDGVLAEFASAVSAVAAGLALQNATAADGQSIAEDRRIVLRIGINLGEVLGEGADVYGEAVNVAARLEALAAPGQIYVSGKVRDEVLGRFACRFADIGEQKLKNMSRPVRVFRVSDEAPSEEHPPFAGRASARPSIAILPLTSMSADPDGQNLGDGLTEDIITELSRFRQLHVAARNSSFRFRGRDVDLVRAGRELGVQFLVEGSVRISGDNLRITVQLIDAASGHHVWAERFDRQMQELFAIQDQVVRTIAATVLGRVKAAVLETALRKPPASLEAYECVLKADDLPFDDPAGAAGAQRLFERAIELDPAYARAYALFSILYGVRWSGDMSGTSALLDEAFRLAKKSVELDDSDATCQQALGWVYLFRRSFELGEYHMRKGLSLAPNQPTQYASLASLLNALGKCKEAIAAYEEARTIDSYYEPQWYWPMIGCFLYCDRRYEEALAPLHQTTKIAYWIDAYLAASYARLRQMELAQKHSANVLLQLPDFSSARFARKESFKHDEDERHLRDGLLEAGLPP